MTTGNTAIMIVLLLAGALIAALIHATILWIREPISVYRPFPIRGDEPNQVD